MKITVNQLRKIIREEVQKNLTESNFKVGDKVTEKGTDSGWWEILELIPDNRTGKTVAKLKMFSPAGGTTTAYLNTDQLSKVEDWEVIHQVFIQLRDENGEVPLDQLERKIGKPVTDWNETGLRVINGVVTELLGDPPYREKMGKVKNLTGSNPKPVLELGNIYRNEAGHQISIEFLDGEFAGWELLARGKSKSLHGTSEELQAALTAGGFRFDRNENVY